MLMYGISSSGMTITLHYCCGKLDDISFSGVEKDRCPMGDHLKKSGCCNDKQVSAKLHAEQQAATKWVQSTQKQFIAQPYYPSAINVFTAQIIQVNRLARGTPIPISQVPLFIKNCVFRI